MSELVTETVIDASPETVWETLLDFESYPEWNPFMRVTGRPNPDATLVVEMHPPGKRASTFRPTVTYVEEAVEFRWLGHLFVPGIFDGEHRFELSDLGDGRTRFTQAETFRGVLVRVINGWLGDATREGFEAMNEALKRRAERVAAAEAAEDAVGSDAGTTGDDSVPA